MLKNYLQRLLCITSSIFIWYMPFYAQKLKNDTISGKVHQIQEVKVIGDKKKTSLKSSAPMQIIKPEDIEQKGITDISDALRRFSGVNIKDYGGAGGMKTVSVRSLGANHTAISYDGIVLDNCQTGQIDLSSFTLDNIESISLIIGDNNDIFTPARNIASAASLNISTTRPDFGTKKDLLSIQTKAGSFGYTGSNIRYSHRFNNQISFSTLIDGMRADNLYSFTLVNVNLVTKEKRYNNSIWNGRWESNLYLRPNERSQWDTKTYWYVNSRYLSGSVILYNSDSKEHMKEKNFFAQTHYKTYWDNNLSLQMNGKFNWAMSHYSDYGGEYTDGSVHNIYFQRELYGSAALLYTPVHNIAFDYSADYAYSSMNYNSKYNVNPYRHSILQSLTGKYDNNRIKATASLLGSFYINGAKSGDSSDNQNHLSPSMSLSWKLLPEKNFYLRASYKDIFRVATFTENYFDQMGSRDLKPERTKQYNIGITYQNTEEQKSSFSFSLDGYHNSVKDKIVAMPYNMFYWTMVNLGKVNIWGLDATAHSDVEISKKYKLLMDGNYTYQYAVDETDPNISYYKDQIPYTPHHSGGASITFENPIINISFHGTGVTKRFRTSENKAEYRVDGYMECGLALYKKLHLRKTDIYLRGDLIDLFDKQYEIIKNYPMPGRNGKITVKIDL